MGNYRRCLACILPVQNRGAGSLAEEKLGTTSSRKAQTQQQTRLQQLQEDLQQHKAEVQAQLQQLQLPSHYKFING